MSPISIQAESSLFLTILMVFDGSSRPWRFSLPLAVLDKLAKKAARHGFKPLHFAKMKLQEFAEEKEAK